ncbi:MAG: alr0857 family protein [Microcoleaceae cyanobacterium]
MLKLTYAENMFYMERLTQAPEQIVSMRVKLAMRLGCRVYVQPSTAGFLLPRHFPTVALLEEAIECQNSEAIALCIADAETLEVSLTGTWITEAIDSEDGVFVTALNLCTEHLVFNLWQAAYAGASAR